jgi:hypothetical protein
MHRGKGFGRIARTIAGACAIDGDSSLSIHLTAGPIVFASLFRYHGGGLGSDEVSRHLG